MKVVIMTDMSDIRSWAATLIETHKNPSKHANVVSNKSLIPTKSEAEVVLIDARVSNLLEVCSRDRVERRCARATGCWLPLERLVEVKKICRLINNFGFANKSGKYLYPEEGMFLLETNRVEIFWDEVPLSLQQAYAVLIGENLHKYVVYRKLALQGFRLTRPSLDVKEPCSKRHCALPSNEKEIDSVSKMLRDTGPTTYQSEESTDNFDYKVYAPEQSNKGVEDFKLCISESDTVPADICLSDGKTITSYSKCNYSCFQYCRINLPDLH